MTVQYDLADLHAVKQRLFAGLNKTLTLRLLTSMVCGIPDGGGRKNYAVQVDAVTLGYVRHVTVDMSTDKQRQEN